MKLISSLILICSSLIVWQIKAEPWLSTRFSNNCAGCHSPGRVNLKPAKRRCSLSCQGCHVNPNGGGIRNHYGKWNSQRWLKSFDSKGWLHGKKTPAPRDHQKYAKAYPKSVAPEKTPLPDYSKVLPKKKRRSIVELSRAPFKQEVYGKGYDTAFHYEAKKKSEFFKFLTREDPYVTERKFSTTTNTELRYLYLSNDGDQNRQSFSEDTGQGFMALDFGLRMRPKKKGLSFVFEQRYLNSPYNSEWDSIFGIGVTRSAYVLVDELPYNTYAMAGIYRPMFGHHSSNHRSIRETIAFGDYGGFGGSAAARFAGVSIGATPTIPSTPFFNINLLTSTESIGIQTEGLVANAGVRFVTLGLSGHIAYWGTEQANTGHKNNMFSITGGMNYKGFIMNAEVLTFDQRSDFSTPSGVQTQDNSGTALTLEIRKKIWRESYLVLAYGSSNTSITQAEGSSSELTIGYKLFALAGSEFDLSYSTFSNDDEFDGEADWNSIQFQTHLYF